MKYIDRIYGEINIDEDVITEIIASSDFQRLKGVDQAGYFDVYFPGTKHSRFEHSIGCYVLLRKFGAMLEEQIAGLIHDLSHSAFSHTADYVFSGGSGAAHNYQDDIFTDFVSRTDIPKILKKHGHDPGYILNEKNFPLQENDLPDLCADRIDYSLRGARIYAGVEQKVIDDILAHLQVIENKWVFDAFEPAMTYANIFRKLNDVYYAGKETGAMFFRSAAWLRYAVKKGYVTKKDIFMTDDHVITKINQYTPQDAHLDDLWEKMNDPEVRVTHEEKEGSVKVIVKSRIIDPLYLEDGNLERVSERNREWKDIVKKNLSPRTYYIVEK